jgi:Phage tail lysozyme
MAGPTPTGGKGSSYTVPTSGPVTPREIYQLLINKGASTIQAIGIMANMINESSLNPESGGIDSNGLWAGGLISWNTGSYPNAHQLVTGNPQQDVRAQVDYLFASTNGIKQGLSGGTAAQVASNFAQHVEVCQGCNPGGSQNASRVANASTVAGWVRNGSWPTAGLSSVSLGGGSTSGGGAGAATGSGSPCVISAPTLSLPIVGKVAGGGCILSKSNVRAFLGTGLLVSGGLILIVGLGILAAYGLKNTGAGRAAGSAAGGALEAAGLATALVPGGEVAGAAIAGAGHGVRRQSRASAKPGRAGQAAQGRKTARQNAAKEKATKQSQALAT